MRVFTQVYIATLRVPINVSETQITFQCTVKEEIADICKYFCNHNLNARVGCCIPVLGFDSLRMRACVCTRAYLCHDTVLLETYARGALCPSPVATFWNTNVCECADAAAVYSTIGLEGLSSKTHLLVDYYLQLSNHLKSHLCLKNIQRSSPHHDTPTWIIRMRCHLRLVSQSWAFCIHPSMRE